MPSKIPVGFFRVEEEKRINRALSQDRSGMTKMIRERSMSRIPVFSNRSPYHVIINTVYYTFMYFVCWKICCMQVFNRIANVLHLCPTLQEPEESLQEGRGRRRFQNNPGGIATR